MSLPAQGFTTARQAFRNAKDVSLAQGGASPVMTAETILFGVLEPLIFSISIKRPDPVSFVTVETFRNVATQGSVQPLEVRELAIKSEGTRRWTWLKILALPDLILRPGDVINIQGTMNADPNVPYRVMGQKPWQQKGYSYYEIVADYEIPPGYVDPATQTAETTL